MTSFFKRNRKTPKLGQHLLTSSDIARHTAEAGSVEAGNTVLEVGPGTGILTRELLNMGARVIAIEKDPAMLAALREEFARDGAAGKLVLIDGDARGLSGKNTTMYRSVFSELGTRYKVIANIPYYITGELIRLFLTAKHQPSSVALLVQKEVAERIARSSKESLLSLSVKAYGTPRYVKTVKAGSFNPPPKVDSAILAISNISRGQFNEVDEIFFFKLLRAGFGQKRKTLKGNLKRALKFSDATLDAAWQATKLNPDVRAEDVPIQQWFNLAPLLAHT